MKAAKITFLVLIAALVAVGISTTSYAFHGGGVAECSGCHSMHNPAPTGYSLLVGSDASSTCLSCHEHAGDTGPASYHISTAEADMPVGTSPLQRTPGGDFGWLKKTYTWAGRGGATATEEGHTHGHNVIAADKGYVVDPVNTTAPGGSFPSSQLACNSCHDPHGKYRRHADGTITAGATIGTTDEPIANSGSYATSIEPSTGLAVGVYRLLAGNAYSKDGITFTGVPAAKAPSSYNRTEAATQTRVAYGNATTGGHVAWGTWCSTCHSDMHSSGGYVHPTDESLSGGIAANYNAYLKTGDMTGDGTAAFTSLVPFIESTTDYTVLASHAKNDDSFLTGPLAADRVSCLSCHRAHASAWEYAIRWNPEYEFLTTSAGAYYEGGYGGRGRTAAEVEDSYYDRPATVFAASQRSLCNKCHAQD